jgi:regulator of Ty1 transposition protein 109
MNLRDSLLASLTRLAGTREFHLHVLVSSPRKCSSLFPFAIPRPRSYLQDILILLSEQRTPDAPRLFVTAIEASVYNVPATSSAILYISKVDSTGRTSAASPTAPLVRSLIMYYLNHITRPISVEHIWIHVFARAQGQYLFPNSSEYSGKRPLSDVKLCGWWKRLFSDVAHEIEGLTKDKAELFYVFPGYTETEAIHSLNFASTSNAPDTSKIKWTYGHPYSQSEIPLPCPKNTDADAPHNLGHYVPSFDDDPKSRFMDEIAYTTEGEGIKSPEPKRRRTTSGPAKNSETVDESRSHAPGDLEKVTPHEFWERMSFRQECVAGAVTGFFVMGYSCPSPKASGSAVTASPLEPQPGQVSSQLNKRIMTSLLTGHEFSTLERSIKATEALEGSIKGLCEGLAPVPASTKPMSTTRNRDSGRRTPEPQSRITLAPPSTPPPRHTNNTILDISPNPFPEPVASLETYHSYIYGSVCVSNPPLAPKAGNREQDGDKTEIAPVVTVLTVRKKKKKVDS